MTLSNDDEAGAALSEMGALLHEAPPIDSPKGRRLIWLAKEVKDWLLDEGLQHAAPLSPDQRQAVKDMWREMDAMERVRVGA